MSDLLGHPGRPQNRYGSGSDPEAADSHVADLAALYALGALEPEEREQVERHILACPPCAQLVAADQRTVGLMPFLAPPARPAPDVKISLFARIAHAEREALPALRAARRRIPSVFTLPSSRPNPIEELESQPQADRPLLPARRGRRGWTAMATSLATVPLLLALTLTGFWGLQLRDKVDDRTAEMQDLQARLNMLGGFGADSEYFPLSAGPAAPQAQGRIYTEPDSPNAVLVMDLGDAEPGRDYGLYVVNQDNVLVRVDAVDVDEDGIGIKTFTLAEPLDNYRSVHIKPQPLTGGDDEPDPASNGIPPDALSLENGSSIGSVEDDEVSP